MATLSGKSARVRITATATSSTGEAATRSTGTTGNGYVQVDSTAKRHFNRNNSTAFTLYLNTTAVSSTAYSLNTVLGRFEWKSGDPVAGTYTADIEYVPTSFLGETESWSLDASANMLERTSFSTSTSDSGWRTFYPGLSEASVTLSRYVASSTGTDFIDGLDMDDDVIVELVMDQNTRAKYEGWAFVSGDSYASEIDGNQTENVTLQVDDTLYFSTR